MVEMVSLDTSVPYTSARWAHTSPVVNPLAVNEMTRLSTPPKRRCRLATICGVNVPSRSRGTSIAHRPDVGDQRLGALAVAGVAVPAPLVAVPAQVRVHLPSQGRFQEPLGQLLQQPTLTQQRHPLGAGLLGQGRHGVVVEHRSQQILTRRRRGSDRIDRGLCTLLHNGCHQDTPLSRFPPFTLQSQLNITAPANRDEPGQPGDTDEDQ